MEQELQKIRDLRRQGISEKEFWQFILQSPARIEAWIHSQIGGSGVKQIWRFFMEPARQSYLHHHLRNYSMAPELNWWALFQSSPWKIQVEAIKELGRSGETGIPLLIQIIEELPELRHQALWELTHFGQNHPEVLEVLLFALQDPQPNVQWQSLSVLNRLRFQNNELTEQIRSYLKTKPPYYLRNFAEDLLRKIEGKKRLTVEI